MGTSFEAVFVSISVTADALQSDKPSASNLEAFCSDMPLICSSALRGLLLVSGGAHQKTAAAETYVYAIASTVL